VLEVKMSPLKPYLSTHFLFFKSLQSRLYRKRWTHFITGWNYHDFIPGWDFIPPTCKHSL